MSLYELAILGNPTHAEQAALIATIGKQLAECGLSLGVDLVIRDAATLHARDPRAPLAGCIFYAGALSPADIQAAEAILAADAPLIPTISPLGRFTGLPDSVASANGLRRRHNDVVQAELATALLECVGLLRAQRRLFVSYRRVESRSAAVQLHDALSGRGYDVFLDTHDIRPGGQFQDQLWHRLCDTDVMVMLDTPGYFDSRWTAQEIGRARAKGIYILRVVWPGHTPVRFTDIADTHYLKPAELRRSDGGLKNSVIDRISLDIERLRSRALAARHRLMTGRLAAEAESVGCVVEGVGRHRAIAIRLAGGDRLWAYPVIGVPTAELMHDILEKAQNAGQDGRPALVYDHIGLRPQWQNHLDWLAAKIPDLAWIKVTEASWTLAGMERGNG
jgi:hypothetical protein